MPPPTQHIFVLKLERCKDVKHIIWFCMCVTVCISIWLSSTNCLRVHLRTSPHPLTHITLKREAFFYAFFCVLADIQQLSYKEPLFMKSSHSALLSSTRSPCNVLHLYDEEMLSLSGYVTANDPPCAAVTGARRLHPTVKRSGSLLISASL